MVPAAADPMLVFGTAKLVWLSALNASPRICTLSFSPKRKFRKIEKSSCAAPGPRKSG